MEWVYISDQEDEPILYEGDGQLEQQDGIASRGADSDVSSLNGPSPEYYGDDVEEYRLRPSEAFEHLSDLILGQNAKGTLGATERIGRHERLLRSRKTSIAESREERIRRLRLEIEELSKSAAADADPDSKNIFAEFREQLTAIEHYTSSLSTNTKPRTRIDIENGSQVTAISSHDEDRASASGSRDPRTDEQTGPSGKDGFTVNVYAPNLASLLSLEERVASLERVMGSSIHVEAQDTNLCKLMDEVRSKLELVDDEGCGDRLKREAEQISSVLKQNFDSQSIAEPLRLGTVLNKMEEWENVVATIPTVVGRLRSLKRLHDEASGFVSTVRDLNAKYEAIVESRQENKELVSTLNSNLVTNLAAINENMKLLESRLDALPIEK